MVPLDNERRGTLRTGVGLDLRRRLGEELDRALSASDQQRRELTFAAQERVRERHAPEPYARGLQNLLRRLSHEPDAPPLWDVAGVAGRGL